MDKVYLACIEMGDDRHSYSECKGAFSTRELAEAHIESNGKYVKNKDGYWDGGFDGFMFVREFKVDASEADRG